MKNRVGMLIILVSVVVVSLSAQDVWPIGSIKRAMAHSDFCKKAKSLAEEEISVDEYIGFIYSDLINSNPKNGREILRKTVDAIEKQSDRLSLQNLEITYEQLKLLMPLILENKNLKFFELSQNHLERLPELFGEFVGLEWLGLSGNKLKCLPVEFRNLTKLVWLDLSNNKLEVLPESIGCLESLEFLDTEENELTGEL